MWSLYLCERTYQEIDQVSYDKEKLEMSQLHDAVIDELNTKYSKRDADKIQSKASQMASSVENKKYYLQFCADTMRLLQQRRSGPIKSYLLPD
jgi:predicted S18 family serine protease